MRRYAGHARNTELTRARPAENFWTSFFAPSYDAEKGFNWSVGFLPDVPIFAFSVADIGGLVVPAFREPEKYTGTHHPPPLSGYVAHRARTA